MSTDAFSYATDNGHLTSYAKATCKSCRHFHPASDSKDYGECYYWPPRTIVVGEYKHIDTPVVMSQRPICAMFAQTFTEHKATS